MSLFDTIENKLLGFLQPIIGPIKGLVSLFTNFRNEVSGLINDASEIGPDFEQLITDIRDFKLDPDWKHRVISVPLAVEKIEALLKIPGDIASKVRDLFQQVKSLTGGGDTEPNLEELEGVDDLKALVAKGGEKLAAGFAKLLDFLALALQIFQALRSTLSDVKGILDDLTTIVEDLNNFDALFLQNHNKRKSIASELGPLRLRVGKLHETVT